MTTTLLPIVPAVRFARMRDYVSRHPESLVAALIVIQTVLWTFVPALTSSALPRNDIEGYMWGREWLLLSYKHPQLPAWCLEISRIITGVVGWPAYLVSQIFVSATFFFVYMLGKDLFDKRAAAAGTLLLTGFYFFSWPTVQFDHNVAQMPLWAAVVWFLWRSVERNRTAYWLGLSIASGIGMYAKFSTALLLLVALVWLLSDAKARSRLRSAGPWLALLLFLAIILPLAVAVVRDGFQPLTYVETERDSMHHFALAFVLKQLGNNIAFALLLILSFWRTEPDAETPPLEGRARAFLLVFALAPLLLLAAASLDGRVSNGWAAPMYNLLGLVAVLIFRNRLTPLTFRRLSLASLAIAALFPLARPAIGYVQARTEAKPRFVSFLPEDAIARRFAAIWQEQTGRPLRLVGGDALMSGFIAAPLADAEDFTELDQTKAPWVTAAQIERDGVLVVWTGHTAPDHLSALEAKFPVGRQGEESFEWSPSQRAKPVVVHYAIIPPAPGRSALPSP